MGGSYGNTFTVWRLNGKGIGKRKQFKIPKVGEQSDVWTVAVSPDGKRVVTGHMDSSITLWNVDKGKQVANFFVQNASTMAVTFGSDGTVFATAQQDGSVRIFETTSGRHLARLVAHDGAAKTVDFHPQDGTTLITGGEDGRIVVWRTPQSSFAG